MKHNGNKRKVYLLLDINSFPQIHDDRRPTQMTTVAETTIETMTKKLIPSAIHETHSLKVETVTYQVLVKQYL